MYKLAGLTAVLTMLAAMPAQAAVASLSDFAGVYEIELENAKLPTLEELQKDFKDSTQLYDTHYTSVFDLGTVFDPEFAAAIKAYGQSEKRLKWPEEEVILEILAAVPASWYEYIGPQLFDIPNMSEKILNLPGIKETKNKFPSRVAKQLQDIEDLEFLSPYLYYMLMPEIWPGNDNNIEVPKMTPVRVKVAYDADFYRALRRLVPPENYMPGGKTTRVTRSDMRTIHPDKNSLLTSADIKAFAATIAPAEEWAGRPENKLALVRTTVMLQNYINRKNDKAPIAGFREVISPCSALVEKAMVLGKERELAKIAAKQGFTLTEWAYTCDKTVKAWRLSKISTSLMQSLRLYKSGFYDKEIAKLSPRSQYNRYAGMAAVLEMYKAPLADVLEVRKNDKLLHDEWFKSDFEVGGVPIGRLD